MATCPRCHGHLTDGHICSRSKGSVGLELVLTALVGGLAAIVFMALFDPQQVTVDLDGLVFALGALFALAVHQFFMWSRKK
jgi:hypothetical protein